MRRCSVSAVPRAGGADRPNEGEEMTRNLPTLGEIATVAMRDRDVVRANLHGCSMQMSPPPQPSPNDLMRFRTFIAAGLAALASACAGHPDSSAPTYVPPSTFENLTCRQLGEEQKRITRAEATGGRL